MENIKIAIITNIPTPYRRKQWEYFSNQENLDITIYYSAINEYDRLWTYKNASNVKEKFMKGFSWRKFHFNTGIFKVITGDYDLFFMGNYGYPTTMMCIFLLKLLKKPWVLIHDGISPLKINKEKWHVKLIKRIFMKGADAYFANGTITRRELENYGIINEKIFNQYLTVDVKGFMEKRYKKEEFRRKLRSKYGIDGDVVVLMYSGRLLKFKGVQDLILATKELIKSGYDIHTIIVGEGTYKNNLKDLSEKIKSKVVFTGHIEEEEIHKYYYTSDIFILPTHNDPWGLVVNEAMACGLPVIASSAAGCSLDLIKNNGYVFQEKNVAELCSFIIKLMDPEVRKDCSKKSMELINNWTFKNSLESFTDLLKYVK